MAVKIHLPSIDVIKKNSKNFSMEAVGFKVRELVEKQLRKELDGNGKKMPRYSKIWQARRTKLGFNPGIVDLTITGHMLRSIDNVRVTKNSVVVGFNNAEAKRYAIGVLRNKKRPISFLGLSRKSEKKLVDWMFKKVTQKR